METLEKNQQNLPPSPKNPTNSITLKSLHSELKTQWRITVPLLAMNLTWFAKLTITTAFLGRQGSLPLAAGSLALTFANVTGFSVLNGLCGAMEPICGQAFGAKNFKLLHKTLFMAIFLLLVFSLPISLLWLNVDKILIAFGQEREISNLARRYLIYLLPDLVATSFLCPLKSYLSTQNITVPIMLSSVFGVALHVPANVLLSRAKGLEGIAIGVWITDFVVVILLCIYVFIIEKRSEEKWKEGGWWELNGISDWIKLVKLSGPCCLTTCLEWWCIEILVLLAGRLPNAKQSVGVIAIVLNFDYLLYSAMLSLSTCASIRVSNELGANRPRLAYRAAYVALAVSIMWGFIGGATMVGARGAWGPLFSRDHGILMSVKRVMVVMSIVEVVNFPLVVCGGVMRGTAKPMLGFYAYVCGFYLLALPLAVVLAFQVKVGVEGLVLGLLGGSVCCLVLLLVFVLKIRWDDEAEKAQVLTCCEDEGERSQDSLPT